MSTSQYNTGSSQTILWKNESTPGVDAAPVPGSDAVLCEAPASDPNLRNRDTNEVTSGLDGRPSLPNGGTGRFSCRVNLHGSGAAGTAPEYASGLKSCGLGQTDLAADATGTAQAGAAGSITLAAGASSTTDIYRGFVVEITGGTGAGQKRVIAAYNGTTKVASVTPSWTATVNGTAGTAPDATSVYAVRKGNLFKPISSGIPLLSIYHYRHRRDGGNSRLTKLVGSSGNVRLGLSTDDGCALQFDFQGVMQDPSDVSPPATPTLNQVRAPGFLAAQCFLANSQIAPSQLQLDLGNKVDQTDDPNTPFGYGEAGITGRKLAGSFQAPQELQAVRDVFAAWKAGSTTTMSLIWGSTAGNRFALLFDQLVYTGRSDADVRGFGYEQMPFGINATNDGFLLCCW